MKQRYKRNRSSKYNFAENICREKRASSLLWLRLTYRGTYYSYKSYVCVRSISLTGFPKSNVRFLLCLACLYTWNPWDREISRTCMDFWSAECLSRVLEHRFEYRSCVWKMRRPGTKRRCESLRFNSESLPPLLHCPLKSAWNGREKKNLARLSFQTPSL